MYVQIISMTKDPNKRWKTLGLTRGQAKANWHTALETGNFERPQYIIVVKPKTVFVRKIT